MRKVGVIGAGGLGTALGQTIANNVDEVISAIKIKEITNYN